MNKKIYLCVGCGNVHRDIDHYSKEDGDLLIKNWEVFLESVEMIKKELETEKETGLCLNRDTNSKVWCDNSAAETFNENIRIHNFLIKDSYRGAGKSALSLAIANKFNNQDNFLDFIRRFKPNNKVFWFDESENITPYYKLKQENPIAYQLKRIANSLEKKEDNTK